MRYLIQKLKSLFKYKEKEQLVWLLDKDFSKKVNIQMRELDVSKIQATKLKMNNIKQVWNTIKLEK